MSGQVLTQNERDLLRVIRENSDPGKTMAILMDMFMRSAAGESLESIAESYGAELEEIKNRRVQK